MGCGMKSLLSSKLLLSLSVVARSFLKQTLNILPWLHFSFVVSCETNSNMSTTALDAKDDLDRPNIVKFFVTGFGKFGDVKDNPTTTLVTKLVDFLRNSSDASTFRSIADNTQTMVIEVSVEATQSAIETISEEIGNHNTDEITTHIVLHLGVDVKGDKIKLEKCAFNEATFRLPDERGFQPQYEPVKSLESWPIGTEIPTLIDTVNLMKTLCQGEQVNPEHISLSSDPGRFVCNYTYGYSLNKFQCSSVHGKSVHRADENNDKIPKAYCLFVHVPPFAVLSEELQLEIVSKIMLGIQRTVSCKSDSFSI